MFFLHVMQSQATLRTHSYFLMTYSVGAGVDILYPFAYKLNY